MDTILDDKKKEAVPRPESRWCAIWCLTNTCTSTYEYAQRYVDAKMMPCKAICELRQVGDLLRGTAWNTREWKHG